MDYKEKYEQALERCKKEFNFNNLAYSHEEIKQRLERVFPELKESEDEKWRNWLIGHLEGYINQTDDKYAKVCKKAISWLEKQGKIKRSDYPYVLGWRENRPDNKPKIKHSILMLTTHGVAEGEWLGEEWCQYRWSCKIKDTQVLYWLHLSDLETLEKENVKQDFSWLEKQGEQKPAENKGMNLVEEEMTPFQKKVFCIIDTTIEEEQGLKQVCDELLRLAHDEIMQKPAWSEEDEQMINDIIEAIDTPYSVQELEMVTWLKSLKPHPHWKPSEEQMMALNEIINTLAVSKHPHENGYLFDILNGLRQNLKKL